MSNLRISAEKAAKILKKEFDLKLVDVGAWIGKYKQFKFNIVGVTGKDEIRLPNLRFKQLDTSKYININMFYNIDSGVFIPRPMQEKYFVDNNGRKWKITEGQFFSSTNKFRTEDGDYILKATGEIITKKEYYNLESTEDNDIETYSRKYIETIFSEHLNSCNFEVSYEQLWDARPEDTEEFKFKRYNTEEMKNIAKKINLFATGRNISEVKLEKDSSTNNQSTEKREISSNKSKEEDQDTY